MLFINKQIYNYLFIILTACCIQNGYAYNTSKTNLQKTNTDQALNYVVDRFSPFEVAHVYISYNPKFVDSSGYSYINLGIEKNIGKYINYAFECSVIKNNSIKLEEKNKWLELLLNFVYDTNFAVKLKFPFQVKGYYFAPYTGFMLGTSVKGYCFLDKDGDKHNHQSIKDHNDFYFLRFGKVQTVKLGFEFYLNEWIGIFVERQYRAYHFRKLKAYDESSFEISNLFIIGLKTSF